MRAGKRAVGREFLIEKVIVKRIPFFVKWKKSGWSIEKNDNAGEWNSRLADEAGLIPRCCSVSHFGCCIKNRRQSADGIPTKKEENLLFYIGTEMSSLQ